MYQRLEEQAAQRQTEHENSLRRGDRQEDKAAKAAAGPTRKSARGNTEQESSSRQLQSKKRDRTKTMRAGNQIAITEMLDKDEVKARTGGITIDKALEKEAQENKSGGFGATVTKSARQPELVTGATMKPYQLEGLEWLISLYENGLNGILADEMGLGKTIQTISLIAFLRSRKQYGPFLIVAPLSTITNWIDEFAKFTPDIPTLMYHGSKDERDILRAKHLKDPGSKEFPVVCTTYEISMNDRSKLSWVPWRLITIDEGHRLKNLNCRLIKELKQFTSSNRLLLTGTPLQNNLSELWSLLNFLMPDIFDNLESFESWFDFSALSEKEGHKQILDQEKQSSLISSLHAILKPFLLRRIKADVETSLPKKREYILYAPMTVEQQELYKEILEGDSRSFIENKVIERINASRQATPKQSRASSLKRKAVGGSSTTNKSARTSRASTPGSIVTARGRKAKVANINYKELNEMDFTGKMKQDSSSEEANSEDEEVIRSKTLALARREVMAKKLQNPIMQLRLVCNSPHNFYWPYDEADALVDERVVKASGKMMLLDRLVPALFAKGHKILIFSQFRTTLDIIQDWAEDWKKYSICRIDGMVESTVRKEMIRRFNDKEAGYDLFLLSTRAGGQGINLAAADTVILFDSDWNPQQDLQAQDRAHRIGQTKPVIIYRFATKGTVEQTLLEKADGKRRLEKLVIQKGKFKSMMRQTNKNKDEVEELQRLLMEEAFEKFEAGRGEGKEVLSDAELAVLMDRSEEAYLRAEKGEGGGDVFKVVETKGGEGLLQAVGK